MPISDYSCRECLGGKLVVCPCCGNDVGCEACDGSGLDDSRLDVKAFRAVEAAMLGRDGATWDWFEGGVLKGRRSRNESVAYENFVRKDVQA